MSQTTHSKEKVGIKERKRCEVIHPEKPQVSSDWLQACTEVGGGEEAHLPQCVLYCYTGTP